MVATPLAPSGPTISLLSPTLSKPPNTSLRPFGDTGFVFDRPRAETGEAGIRPGEAGLTLPDESAFVIGIEIGLIIGDEGRLRWAAFGGDADDEEDDDDDAVGICDLCACLGLCGWKEENEDEGE